MNTNQLFNLVKIGNWYSYYNYNDESIYMIQTPQTEEHKLLDFYGRSHSYFLCFIKQTTYYEAILRTAVFYNRTSTNSLKSYKMHLDTLLNNTYTIK